MLFGKAPLAAYRKTLLQRTMKCLLVSIVMLSVAGGWETAGQAQDSPKPKALLEKVKVLTCVEPPYQILEGDKQLTGASVELVQLMLKEAGVDTEIQVLPWARAYHLAQKKKNVMLFSILRNSPREKLFKWVGILHSFHVYFYRLKDRPEIVVDSLEDAKKYTIGVLKDDSREIFLRTHGFDKQLKEVSLDEQNIKKLFTHRIDLLPSDPFVLAYWLKEINADPVNREKYKQNQIEQIYHIEGADGDNYIVMSPQTDDNVVEYFRQALERVKSSPSYRKILSKYFGNSGI